MNVTELIP